MTDKQTTDGNNSQHHFFELKDIKTDISGKTQLRFFDQSDNFPSYWKIRKMFLNISSIMLCFLPVGDVFFWGFVIGTISYTIYYVRNLLTNFLHVSQWHLYKILNKNLMPFDLLNLFKKVFSVYLAVLLFEKRSKDHHT